jgi:hypothetical protein
LCDTISRHLDEPKIEGDVDKEFDPDEQDDTFLEDLAALSEQMDSFDYAVEFKLKHDGSLGFDFRWAEDVNPAVASNAFANFLLLIHNGKIKNQFIEGLRAHGIQTGTTPMTDLIMNKFMAVDEEYAGNQMAVDPLEIFGQRD